MSNRKPYPSDVSDEEWAFVAPYLTLVREDAPQRTHDIREVTGALRWIVRAGASWRMSCHMTFLHGRLSTSKQGGG
jgi:transposase